MDNIYKKIADFNKKISDFDNHINKINDDLQNDFEKLDTIIISYYDATKKVFDNKCIETKLFFEDKSNVVVQDVPQVKKEEYKIDLEEIDTEQTL